MKWKICSWNLKVLCSHRFGIGRSCSLGVQCSALECNKHVLSGWCLNAIYAPRGSLTPPSSSSSSSSPWVGKNYHSRAIEQDRLVGGRDAATNIAVLWDEDFNWGGLKWASSRCSVCCSWDSYRMDLFMNNNNFLPRDARADHHHQQQQHFWWTIKITTNVQFIMCQADNTTATPQPPPVHVELSTAPGGNVDNRSEFRIGKERKKERERWIPSLIDWTQWSRCDWWRGWGIEKNYLSPNRVTDTPLLLSKCGSLL